MAAACRVAGSGTGPDDFVPWLSDKLRALRTDESVFGSYIAGILDGEDSLDDKKEALEGILSEFVERDIGMHVSEILDKWTLCRVPAPAAAAPDVDLQLARLLEAQALATAAPRRYTDEEKKIRDVILSQYSQLSDHEEGVEGGAGGTQTERECGGRELERNTNAETVAAAARERRDQARLDSQRKKEKDKEDREKQKQQKEEKKEKRKTQKGERKR